MKQDVLETLEFDKIREKLAELAPSQLSKAMARTLMPSVEPEIIEKKLTETEEASILLEREITTEEVGEMVMKRLKSVDEVAYVRFASVYRQFKDIDTFMQELTKLLNNRD